MNNSEDIQLLKQFFDENGWQIRWEEIRPACESKTLSAEDLNLNAATLATLEKFGNRLYSHQHEAISKYLAGSNIAVTTATASGKTLIFNACSVETLIRNTNARVAAIYPLKALSSEQELRWRAVLGEAGLDAKVGRIDGDVPMPERAKLLTKCRVLVMTPDILHAWLLRNVTTRAVKDFLRNLSMLILDEAHTYSGVFGSNAAFLFRRLVHLKRKLGGDVRFIASSATMSNPLTHLKNLTGEEFDLIGPDRDTAPRCQLHTVMVDPPMAADLLGAVSNLIEYSAIHTARQSITFVDSRKQTEYIAAITDRLLPREDIDIDTANFDRLSELQIYPYRSGYEADDRRRIHSKLADGVLKGVVSTSALEMGIDLPHLTLGIILGIPRSATSYYQRIGRVGRRKDGIVIVINNGSVMSQVVFKAPERIHSLPLVQSALYLHNPRIQYIHAMCLARHEGEDEIVCADIGTDANPFESPVSFPADFEKLCQSERVGELTNEFQVMKSQAGDDPYHTFPLRDLDMQFRVELRQGANILRLGALSYGQMMREAYPGAVYFHQTNAYRVVRIRKQTRLIEVRPEKRYFTSPKMLPKLILPNLTADNIFEDKKFGSLRVIECGMQIGEAVIGLKERRGPNQFDINYPLNAENGCYFDAPRFARYVFTSGVVFNHPALSLPQVKCDAVAEVIYEAFLMTVPFEPQDVSSGADKHRASREGIVEGSRFVCVYDQTYGSLRLTNHLIEAEILRNVLNTAVEIAQTSDMFTLNAESIDALQQLAADSLQEPLCMDVGGTCAFDHNISAIIKPGSYGVDIYKDNEEFWIDNVFYSPQLGELAYRGKHISEKKKAEESNFYHGPMVVTVPVKNIQPLDGISIIAYYNYDTGEILDSLPQKGEF